ncbi:hypothetical protein L5G28_14820 [Gordonia sp. HY285]|uniref:hypothetical protein n=1 Tax=Gordonia liuliyuniae TaxID=2911517 RepID=UPI001F47FD0C|nr:hypothetical protein [Gordonia liuliyuniae]MCF8611419.1 hypothetical protein [Gordonia liuliyuniae]
MSVGPVMRVGELTGRERLAAAASATTAATTAMPGYLRRVRVESGGEPVRPPDSRYAREVARHRIETRLRPHSSAAVLWRVGARLPMALNPLAR